MSTPTAGFPEPGRRIGPYEVVRRLGQGGMGVVYEAVDTVLGRRVALKVITPHLASDPAFRVRFTQEAQAQASLDSPHVVQVFAHGEADPSAGSGGTGALYIASQLIPDGDLGAMVKASGPPPPGVALDVIAQVAAGLADAHAAGLVHRDIKPANVLLRIRGEEVSAYLADFGIARRTDIDPQHSQTLSTQGFVVGTPSYMAPELHTGGRHGTASDVYSLGCLLWAALVGSAPYTGTTDYQLVNAHVSAPIPQLAPTGQWEREVNRVLRTAMAKHPRERYPSAAGIRDDLRRAARTYPAPTAVLAATGAEPPPSAPPPPTPHSPPPAPTYDVYTPAPSSRQEWAVASGPRSNGLLVGLGLALVLIVVIGVVVAVALVSNGGGDDSADVTARSTSEATDVSTDQRSDGPTGGDDRTSDERTAADSIARALRADANFAGLDAECTARRLVEDKGVDELQQLGVLNDDLEFVGDIDPASNPQVFADIISISVTCVFESISIPTG